MSLVEEYYELNEAEEVSVMWKVLQIGLYGLAGVMGLCCGFTLANLRLKFDDRCYLFTEVKILLDEENLEVDESNMNWESDTWCDYYQFSLISSFIVGIIWGTLFLMCGKGGKSVTGLPQPWRIVWPSLIFNFIYFIIILSTAIHIQKGTNKFCGRDSVDKKNPRKSFLDRCEVLKLMVKRDVQWTALQMEVVVKTSWGCVLTWFSLFLLSLLRILFVVDFYMYKICVFKIDDAVHNKKEEVLKITNYEEPKKLYFEKVDEREIPKPKYVSKEESDAAIRKRTKLDKKQTRNAYNITSQYPLKPNAVFYETTDIRMLNRDKKRKKSPKDLDSAIGSRIPLRQSNKIQSDSEASTSSKIPSLLYQYSDELFTNGDDEENESSTAQKSNVNQDWNETGSGSGQYSINVPDLDSNPFLRLKKQI